MGDEFVAETTTGGSPTTDGMPAMNRALRAGQVVVEPSPPVLPTRIQTRML